jgi:hypothetical protein
VHTVIRRRNLTSNGQGIRQRTKNSIREAQGG